MSEHKRTIRELTPVERSLLQNAIDEERQATPVNQEFYGRQMIGHRNNSVERLFIGGSLDGQRRMCDGIRVSVPMMAEMQNEIGMFECTIIQTRQALERYRYVSICGTAVMAEENLLVSEIMAMLLDGYKPKGKSSE